MENDVKIDVLQGNGGLASRILNSGFNVNLLRPYVAEDGHFYVNGGTKDAKPTPVANALLRKDEWIALDRAVTPVARQRMKFVMDLEAMGMTKSLPNAMGITQYQWQNMSDISDASVSMSPANKGDHDRPEFDLNTIPIPIVHKDFKFDIREIATSRNMGASVDTLSAELAAIKVAETIEKLHLGTYGTYKFGGANLYGLRNFTDINDTTYSDWSASSKTNKQRLEDILGFINTLRGQYQYGPYGIYVASNLEQYLDEDYVDNYPTTLRERVLKIGNEGGDANDVQFVRSLDYLNADDIVVVSFGNRSVRTMQGMRTRVVQWSEEGGMVALFKVMAIQVPLMTSDYNDKCGVLLATKA